MSPLPGMVMDAEPRDFICRRHQQQQQRKNHPPHLTAVAFGETAEHRSSA